MRLSRMFLVSLFVFALVAGQWSAMAMQGSDGIVITPGNADQVIELDRFGRGRVYDIAVNPDGKTAAVATDIGIWFYDLNTVEPVRFLEGHSGWVASVDFAPDGQTLLTGSWDNTVRLWDVQTGETLHVFEGHSDSVRHVKFMQDGQTILSSSSDRTYRLWSAQSGEMLRIIQKTQLPQLPGWNVIAPDAETMLFVPYEGEMRLLDARTGAILRIFEGTWGATASAVFGPDGTILEGVKDGSIRVWDIQTGELLRGFETDYGISYVTISPDGQIVVTCSPGMGFYALHMWDFQTGEHLQDFPGYTSWPPDIAFTPDSQTIWFVAREDDALYWWDVASGEAHQSFAGHSGVWDMAFSPDGQTIVASGPVANIVRLWDVQTGEIQQVFAGNDLSTYSVAFAPGGQTVVSGGCDGTEPPYGCVQNNLRLWDVQSGELLRVFEGNNYIVDYVSFSPDGRTVISGTRLNDLRLWDVDTGDMRWAADVPSQAIDFAPDGQTVVAGGYRGLHLIDTETGVVVRDFEGYGEEVWSVDFAPNGHTFLSGSDYGTLKLWDVRTGEVVRVFADHVGGSNVTYSPNGQLVVSSSGGSIYLRDALTGEILRIVDGHQGSIGRLAFSPDGTRIASASKDGTIRIWGLPSMQD